MAPLPYSHSGAKIAFYIALGTWVLLEQRIRIRGLLHREGSKQDHGSLMVVVVSVLVGVLGAFALAQEVQATAIPFARWPIFVIGLGLMWAGIALRQWSIALLGRLFTFDVRVHDGQPVVDHGPYRWVRHPSYAGMMITFLGIGLALGSWASLLVLATVPTAGLVFRINSEERSLLEGLGEPYRRFAATRARLIPGVW